MTQTVEQKKDTLIEAHDNAQEAINGLETPEKAFYQVIMGKYQEKDNPVFTSEMMEGLCTKNIDYKVYMKAKDGTELTASVKPVCEVLDKLQDFKAACSALDGVMSAKVNTEGELNQLGYISGHRCSVELPAMKSL